MNYSDEYRARLCTADEAVRLVKNGDWVDYASNNAKPVLLDRALARRRDELHGVKIRGNLTPGPLAVVECDPEVEHFVYHTWHCSGYERKLCDAGRAFFTPMIFRNLGWYYRTQLTVNVAMFCVSPMDSHGYFSFGGSTGVCRDIADTADVIILEVNEAVPRVLGEGESIHISEVTHVVEAGRLPLWDMQSPEPSETDTMIARHIFPHIHDGATVQLGIGGMPNALGRLIAESDLHDLGMHTELCSDAYLDLYEAGVLTNRRCTLHRNQGMLGITIGSQRLYDWVDDNPGVIAAPLSYVNAPEVIAQLDNMVSINSCIAADLYGQVASESSGLRQISGTGGQLDFLTGAAMARGGKAFICMTSTFTDKQGTRRSRILPHFGGDIVTSPRSQAYYLATEYGVVNLAGRSTWERAEALVSIAHPDFREQLIAAAEAQKIWRRSARR